MCMCCAIAMPNIPNDKDPEIAKNQLFQCPTFKKYELALSHITTHTAGCLNACYKVDLGLRGLVSVELWAFNGCIPIEFRKKLEHDWCIPSNAHLPTNLLPVCAASSFVHLCPCSHSDDKATLSVDLRVMEWALAKFSSMKSVGNSASSMFAVVTNRVGFSLFRHVYLG